MTRNVRAIAFDLDNTLWDVEPVLERAEARLYEWLRAESPRITAALSLEDMRRAREALARSEPHHAHDFTYLRTAARAFEVFLAARCEVDLFPDVRPALTRLARRYRLGTLSNGNADLDRIGLSDAFQVSLNARQIGAAKPARRVFEHLSEALGVAPGELWYVGDDPGLDVAAARAAGLGTVWVNRRAHRWPEGEPPADLTVTNLTELAHALGT